MWGGLEVILAVAVCTSLVVILIGCVCGCKKDAHKASAQNTQRSLPEIPPSVPHQESGDTASDLYATVGTTQGVSEHSSPVATRSDHPYEHAYARLQDGSLRVDEVAVVSDSQAGSSSGALVVADESQSSPEAVVITASGAISGQVSSSRELPYMTPPVVTVAPLATPAPSLTPASATAPVDNAPTLHVGAPQHFSGDSVDSAKGYTSISVREPLSSIRANLPNNRPSQPHYATVSDDSDEMYAAIDEPGGSNQVYTSGSETYAQIQPTLQVQATLHQPPTPAPAPAQPPAPVASSAEATSTADSEATSRRPTSDTPSRQNLPKHTRQASNSSCNSSVGTLGSPKPEKRQANSPLPPPPASDSIPHPVASSSSHAHKKGRDSPVHHHPKTSSAKQRISSTGDLHNHPDKLRRSLNEKHQRNNSCVSSSDFYGCNYPVDKHRFSSGDLPRSLVAKELNFSLDKPSADKQTDAIYNTIDGTYDIYAAIDQDAPPKSLPPITSSPSKNVEEMYAKVIKKSKHIQDRTQSFSRLSSHDDIESARHSDHIGSNIGKSRKKSLQHDDERLSVSNETKRYSGTSPSNIAVPNDTFRNSPSPKNVNMNKEDPGYETIDRIRNKNHSYETIDKNVAKHKTDKNNDPGYETVKDPVKRYDSQKHKRIPTVSGGLMQQSRHSIGIEPGYESLPGVSDNDPGYEHIQRLERCPSDTDSNYEVLRPHNSSSPYSSINKSVPCYSVIQKKPKLPEKDWMVNNNENLNSESNYESLPHESIYTTGSESDPNYESVGPKDPNYESVKYFDVPMKEPPYEKVHNDTGENSAGSKFQRAGSVPGYERVKSILKRDEDQNDNRTNGVAVNPSGEMAPVGDYFNV